MREHAPFAKMNGLGNAILVVDMRGRTDTLTPEAARALARASDTHFDQLMAIHDARIAGTDGFVEILNCDGSHAQACGNGMRCVVQALRAQTGRSHFVFQTRAGILNAEQHGDGMISVDMGRPVLEWDRIPLAEEFHDTRRIELQAGPIDAPVLHSPAALSMGNPHAIFFVEDDVWSYDLARIGPLLEHHPIFPDGANISIARVADSAHLTLRTWERGAGLTQACGSAACAAVVAASRLERTGRRVDVNVPGGILSIEWRAQDDHVIMTGPAEWEFSGHLDPASGVSFREKTSLADGAPV